MSISNEVVSQIAALLQEKHGFTTATQLDLAVADLLQKTEQRKARGNGFSLSTAIRGMRAQQGTPINESTKDADIAYVRALSTGSTPGLR